MSAEPARNHQAKANELAELKARFARLDQLQRVSNVIHSTLEPQKAFQLIVREMVDALRAISGSLVLINPTNNYLEILAGEGLPADTIQLRLRLGEGLTGWVARTGKAARIGDVSKDHRYVSVRPAVRSELAVPLEVNDEVRGVLNVDSDRPDAFSEADQQWLEQLAVQASRVVQNTWLYEQFRHKAMLFESLVNVSQTISSTLNLDDALRAITEEGCELMGCKICALQLLDETGEWLTLRACHGAGEAYLNKPPVPVSESLLGFVVRRCRPVQVENVQASGRYQQVEVARAEGLVSVLAVPLRFGSEGIGTLSVYKNEAHTFSNEEIRILSALADLSAIAIEKARLYERIVDVEEQLRQSEKLNALGLLAAEVAHEIRNPLTVMKMLFHSLDLQFPKADQRSEDVRIISDKMELLNRIVEQILDFARNAEPKPSPVNVNQIIEDLGLLTRHKLTNQGVTLRRDLALDLPTVMADAIQLEQVFLNLTLNAVEAMPEGGVLQISTHHVKGRGRGGSHVVIDFADSGVGMTEEQQARAFTSLLNTTKAKGTGLGLALVGRIVETHHGKLSIKSAPGQGTTISVRLPVK
ncbi:GAF domain-containing protein [bacterium]|nr:GAF domain-containing protein [bacterium]